MTTISEIDLQSALNQQLSSLMDQIPIAWENAKYQPEVGTPYLRATLLPAETAVATLGPNNFLEHKGIFQVDCVYPLGEGWGPAKAMAAQIVALFRTGTRLSYNGISILCEKAWPGPGLPGDYYVIPVSIRYSCYSDL